MVISSFYSERGLDIYNGDCVEVLGFLEDGSFDLVVTSPPYNVNLGFNKYHRNPYDLYNDNKEHGEYIAWLGIVFKLIYSKLVDGGRVCINIGDGKNGAVPTSSDVIQLLVHMGYVPYTHIIWDKSQVGPRTAWGSFGSPSCPSFPTPFEHILVFSKGSKKLLRGGETDLDKQEFIDWSLAMWRFAPETRQKKFGHGAMFPEELPKRCIKMLSWKGARVLDPFAGAFTTGVVCKKLGREFVGIELSEEYCRVGADRLSGLSCVGEKVRGAESAVM